MEEETPAPASAHKLSPVPSWVTLGFVLGALVVLALPRRGGKEAETAPSAAGPPAGAALGSAGEGREGRERSPAPRLMTIEDVFAEWGHYAAWSDDTTQVALWDSQTRRFSDCYEVLRVADLYYFRSIPALTRPLLTRDIPEDSPLQFTETPEQREQFLQEVQKENWRAFSDSARQAFGPKTAPEMEVAHPPSGSGEPPSLQGPPIAAPTLLPSAPGTGSSVAPGEGKPK